MNKLYAIANLGKDESKMMWFVIQSVVVIPLLVFTTWTLLRAKVVRLARPLLLLLTALMVMSTGCATVKSDFRAAQREGTIATYQSFIEKYPTHQLAKRARRSIEELIAFEDAQKINTVTAYQEFMKKYPYSQFITQVRESIIELMQDEIADIKTIRIIANYPGASELIEKFLKATGFKIADWDYDATLRWELFEKLHHYRNTWGDWEEVEIKTSINFEFKGVTIYSDIIQWGRTLAARQRNIGVYIPTNILALMRTIGRMDCIVVALESKNTWTRRVAATLIDRDKSAVPALIKILKYDEDVYTRVAAAKALGRIGDKSVIPALEYILTKSWNGDLLHEAAKKALKMLKDEN